MSHHEKCTQLAKMCTQLSRESFSIEGSQPGENDSQLKCVHFRGKKCTQLEKIFWKIGKKCTQVIGSRFGRVFGRGR